MGRRIVALACALVALAIAGCGPESDDSATGPLTVYVGAPLSGEDAESGRDVADGARLALADAGGMAGEAEVTLEVLDAADGPGAVAGWSPGAVGRNARAAAEDTSAIAYIGDLESGATRVSLPITNQALVPQVSPGATALDLVAPPGGGTEVPEGAQPSGERTFLRVIPDDRVQAEAVAAWARELGARQVEVFSDGSELGDAMAEEFSEAAEGIGISSRVAGNGDADAVAERDPGGFVFVAGTQPRLLHEGVERQVAATQAPEQLPAGGREFLRGFQQEYGHAPGPYAAYGYEAMALVLNAIERAGDEAEDRRAVLDELLATSDRESVLGTYSITAVGNTTLDAVAGYRIEGGRPVYDEALAPP